MPCCVSDSRPRVQPVRAVNERAEISRSFEACRTAAALSGLKWYVTALVIILASSCSLKDFSATSVSSTASPVESLPMAVAETYDETGIASWYGKDFHGRKTASGETFDMSAISAAHRTLPLGAVIRVTNLDNFKSIKVKVNDRGPFSGSRILELSYAAARELGFAARGTARVKIEVFEELGQPPLYTVQAASFTEEENAKLLKDRLSQRFELIIIVPFESNLGKFYRVRVGSYGTEEKAESVAGKLKLEGLEPYVIRKD